MFGSLQQIQEAFIIAIPPPPVHGVGNTDGFKLMLEERESADTDLTSVFTTFSASSPQIYLEIDRARAQILNVPIERNLRGPVD